jgi:hypothetical protein
MGVARCLGLDDVSGPALAVAAVAWERWCHLEPDLAVVDDLLNLPDWTRRAPVAAKDGLLVRLHRKAQDDAEAATVLAWLLLPAATLLADDLRDLGPEVDALVASELWMQVRSGPVDRCVAPTIKRAVRRALLAELGHGRASRQRDHTWANTSLIENTADLDILAGQAVDRPDAGFEASHLMQHALISGVLSLPDASLLNQLAEQADVQAAPSRRGRGGLTAPAVVEIVTSHRPGSARSARRAAVTLLKRLGSYAKEHRLDEDLDDFAAAHELPPMSLDDVLEVYLWDHIEDYIDAFHREFGDSA